MSSSFDVAIVGMSGRFPGARTVDAFWRNLVSGTDSISHFTDDEVIASGVDPSLVRDPHYVKAGGILDDADRFDAAFFGYTPREAEIMDPQQRVFLECAWEALEDAGYDTERYRRPVGVYAGMSMNTYVLSNLIYNPAAVEALGEAQAAIANLHDHLATRVSYKLDLRGPSFTVQTACSTSLVAVHLACQALISGECDMALAGGVSVSIPQKAGYLYVDGGTHSPDGQCRAFDAKAQGMVGGSGVGVVVLKRLDDAVADGDRILAVVKGTSVNNDGASKVGYTAPSVDGQARVVRAALRVADVAAETISYIEAHGTGTPIGDPIEIEALARVFRGHSAGPGTVGIGSVKTNVGHLDAAAGVAGLIKVALALSHKQLPPSAHFEHPNPHIDFASTPFFVVDRLRAWSRAGMARRAGVSAFGIGGTNAHAIVEEAPASAPSSDDSPHAFVISARTTTALDAACDRLAAHLETHANPDGDIAWTLQTGRRAFPHRAAVVGRSLADVADVLRRRDPSRLFRRDEAHAASSVRTAFLFPGQGTQYPRMGHALYARFPVFMHAIDDCASSMRGVLDVDLRTLLEDDSPDAAARLQQTEYAQPALFAVAYASANLLASAGITADAFLGHSVGEYVAACLAGVFTLDDAAALVAIRGRLMSQAPRGAMLAVLASEADALGWLSNTLSLAAVNGPAACVLAGTVESIDDLESRLQNEHIACSRLRTSHGFHSYLMDGVVDQFAQEVSRRTRAMPMTPFISNVTGQWITPEAATDPAYWAHHLRDTVRFGDGVATLSVACTRLIEAGPGSTLTTLARQAARGGPQLTTLTTLPKADAATAADETFLNAIARLWTEGAAIDWPRLHEGRRRLRVALPTYPFERQRYWVDRALAHPAGHVAPAATALRLYQPVWRRGAAHATVPGTTGTRSWLVLGDAAGLGRAVANALHAAGHAVTVIDGDAVPGNAEAFERLLTMLDTDARTPDAVVYCQTAAPVASTGSDWHTAQTFAFAPLVALAQAMERRRLFSPVDLNIVSAGVYDIVGDEPLDPLRAALIGPLRVIPQEQPNVRSRHIDVTWHGRGDAAVSDLARLVIPELLVPISDQTVAFRGGQRWTLAYEPTRGLDSTATADATLDAAPIADGAAIVFGGLGQVGSVAARALVHAGVRSIVLASRHATPDHSIVRELTSAGADVLVTGCDLAASSAVASVFVQAKARFGRVSVVVHAAGAAGASAFTSLADLTEARIGEQVGARLQALLALAAVVDLEQPPLVLLTSSLASVLGGLGFGAYAAAHAAIDAFAAAKNRSGDTRWVAVDWDGWRVDAPGAPDSIDATTGRAAFTDLLRHDYGPRVVAATGDLEARLDRWINPGTSDGPAAATVSTASAASSPDEIGTVVLDSWRDLLGIPTINLDDDFFALGGHSLLATQLVGRLRRTLLVDIPLKDVFEHPTARGLAAAIAGRVASAAPAAAAIQPRIDSNEAPLSSQQRRLWFLTQLDPTSAPYVIPGAVRVAGRLDLPVLEQAFTALVQRHESLRTVIIDRGGTPTQVVQEAGPASLVVQDVEDSTTLAERATAAIAAPFDLAHGPLFRVVVFRVSDTDHLVVLAMHHLVSDGWSMAILIRELVALYDAAAAGRASSLPALPLQYADFAVWQQARSGEPDAIADLAYWVGHLSGLAPLQLPTDRPRQVDATSAGGIVSATLGRSTAENVQRLCRDSGATLFMTLLSGFAALLHRYTGQTDVAIGTPSANRNRAELEGVVGCFVNALVLRTDVAAGDTFRSLLARVKSRCLDAWAHQDVPFENIVEALQPQRTPNQNPLFQVMFVVQNAPEGRLAVSGLTFEPVDLPTTTAKFDLSLYVVEGADGISVSLEYNADLFERSTAERMLAHYVRLVAAAAAVPDSAIGALPTLSDREQQQILVEWNPAPTPYPQRSVHSLFSEQAAYSPYAVAARLGAEAITYGELERRANQLAHLLLAESGTGGVVAIALERSFDMLVGLLGILKSGNAYLPLDPNTPADRRAFLLEDVGATVVVDPRCLQSIADRPSTAPADDTTPLDLAYVTFTSGSTGIPKGVAVSHAAVVRLVRDTNYVSLSPNDVVLQFAPLAFDASTFEIWGALLNGGCLAIVPPGTPSLAELGQVLVDAQVTTAWLTAGLFHQMVDHEVRSLCGLRQLIAGGDVLSARHVRALLDAAPHLRVVNGFGPTETTTFACCYDIPRDVDAEQPVSIGSPIANATAYILDSGLAPVPAGVPGELFIGGDGVARGYANRPQITAERFIPDPFTSTPGNRMYRTGDVASWRGDGTIAFLGRADLQVKVRGFRIEPGEIESALAACPGVQGVAVVAQTEDGDKRLVAYVVGDRETASPAALRAFARERLPDYMVPSAVVYLDSLPLTPNGKVNRAALRSPGAAEGGPIPGTLSRPPSTPTEQTVARIWAEVLRVPQVGADDDFFELGGHSLLATQVIARLRDALGVDVPLRELFSNPTVAGLALAVERTMAAAPAASSMDRAVQSIPRSAARSSTRTPASREPSTP